MQDFILKTFDRIEVGCDDEHRNIELLEYFTPIITKAGLMLTVKVLREYCNV